MFQDSNFQQPTSSTEEEEEESKSQVLYSLLPCLESNDERDLLIKGDSNFNKATEDSYSLTQPNSAFEQQIFSMNSPEPQKQTNNSLYDRLTFQDKYMFLISSQPLNEEPAFNYEDGYVDNPDLTSFKVLPPPNYEEQQFSLNQSHTYQDQQPIDKSTIQEKDILKDADQARQHIQECSQNYIKDNQKNLEVPKCKKPLTKQTKQSSDHSCNVCQETYRSYVGLYKHTERYHRAYSLEEKQKYFKDKKNRGRPKKDSKNKN